MMTTQREVAREHGMSFEKAVMGYADDGYSMTMTAQIIGMSPSAFTRLCHRYGWRERFKTGKHCLGSKMSTVARTGVCTDKQRASAQAASDANPLYVCIEYQGVADTLAGHCKRLGLSRSTVYKRWARGIKEPAKLFFSGSYVKPPGTKGHTWRKS